jgi:hypothetical protein
VSRLLTTHHPCWCLRWRRTLLLPPGISPSVFPMITRMDSKRTERRMMPSHCSPEGRVQVNGPNRPTPCFYLRGKLISMADGFCSPAVKIRKSTGKLEQWCWSLSMRGDPSPSPSPHRPVSPHALKWQCFITLCYCGMYAHAKTQSRHSSPKVST